MACDGTNSDYAPTVSGSPANSRNTISRHLNGPRRSAFCHIGGIAQPGGCQDHRDYRGRGPAVFLRTSSAGRIANPGNRLGGRRAGHGGRSVPISATTGSGTSGSHQRRWPAPRQPVS